MICMKNEQLWVASDSLAWRASWPNLWMNRMISSWDARIFMLNKSWIPWLLTDAPSTSRWSESYSRTKWRFSKTLSKSLVLILKKLQRQHTDLVCEKHWPWRSPQTCWYTFDKTAWARQYWSSFTCSIALSFSTPEQYLWTWDKWESLNKLSYGRCWPRTAAWANFVSPSHGLWWVPTFSSEMTNLTWFFCWRRNFWTRSRKSILSHDISW